MFELLQLLHPLLNDVLDFGLGDHQDFLLEEHDKSFREQDMRLICGILHHFGCSFSDSTFMKLIKRKCWSHNWQLWLTILQTHLFFDALFFCWGDVVAAVLSDSTQHADAHLVRATEQLQAFLVLGADLPVQVARLIHQLVPLEGGWLVVWLDVRFAVVGQAHEARLDGLVAPADAEVAEGFPVHVGERGELRKLAAWLVVHVGQIASQHGPRGEGCAALWAAVYAHVVELVPVDLNALQAIGVTTGDGDRVSHCVHTQGTVILWW